MSKHLMPQLRVIEGAQTGSKLPNLCASHLRNNPQQGGTTQKNDPHAQHDCLCVPLVVVDMIVLTSDSDGDNGRTSSMYVSKSFLLCNYVGRIYSDPKSFCGTSNNNTNAYGCIVQVNQLHFHSSLNFCSHDYHLCKFQVNVVTCAHSWLFGFLVQMLGALGYTCRLHTTSI